MYIDLGVRVRLRRTFEISRSKKKNKKIQINLYRSGGGIAIFHPKPSVRLFFKVMYRTRKKINVYINSYNDDKRKEKKKNETFTYRYLFVS